MFHHLYFAGTTTLITAIGAMFSALEVVPLVLLGYDAFENWTVQHKAIWMKPMRWPLMFFIAEAMLVHETSAQQHHTPCIMRPIRYNIFFPLFSSITVFSVLSLFAAAKIT